MLLPRITGTLVHSAARITDCALTLILAVTCTIEILSYKIVNNIYPIQNCQEITDELFHRTQELSKLCLLYLLDIPICLILNLIDPQEYQEIQGIEPPRFCSQPMPIPGFKNEGSNCAFNACLQVLFHQPDFRRIYEEVAIYCNTQADKDDQQCGQNMLAVLKSYNDNDASTPKGSSNASQKMRLAMHHLNKKIGKQSLQHEDAHEIFVTIFTKYEEILKEKYKKTPQSTIKEIEEEIIKNSKIHFKKIITKYFEVGASIPIPESIPSELASDNALKKEEIQQQLKITLNPSKRSLNFNELFQEFFSKKENNSEFDTKLMQNAECVQAKLIKEEQKFHAPPNYLIIQFARFIQTERGASKVDIPIHGISEELNLEPSHSCNNSPRSYQLTSFITHQGELNSGHYIAYRKLGNQWVRCDDQYISYDSLNWLQDLQKSYLCFYKLKTTE